jgi:hypothetical protein
MMTPRRCQSAEVVTHERISFMDKITIARFWSRVDVRSPDVCWIWQAARDGNNYGCFSSGTFRMPAHRFSWVFMHGDIPDGLYVCHRCDTPLCVNPAHLFLGTPLENSRDMVLKGRSTKGRARSLSDEEVAELIGLRHSGMTFESLGKRFGISLASAHNAFHGIGAYARSERHHQVISS